VSPWNGIRIVTSRFAETTKVWHTIERAGPKRKRRKNWRVQRNEKREPCAYRLADGTLVVHPTIEHALRQEIDK
jgi:hypothetical protein